jgi:hypothetical protein
MNITARDRKIIAALAVLGVLAGYWFLLLSPKRAEVTKLDDDVAAQRQQLETARQQLAGAEAARTSFTSDYAEIVRLGKAIPATVDMPSLLVQLDRAAKGTRIDFDKIAVGARVPAGNGQQGGGAPPAQPDGAAAPGGEQAGSAPGQAVEQAGETAADAQTSANAREGSVPVGGGDTGAPSGGSTPAAAPAAPGLDTVPLTFAFEGTFFHLADFFHRLKRFVHVNGEQIVVRGRLMTIDGVTMTVTDDGALTATVKATVYLAPKSEGTAAGATPQGPAPQGEQPQSASSGSPAPPTAAVQP